LLIKFNGCSPYKREKILLHFNSWSHREIFEKAFHMPASQWGWKMCLKWMKDINLKTEIKWTKARDRFFSTST
jgi:hypothetical protein